MNGKAHILASMMLAVPVGIGTVVVTKDLRALPLATLGCAAGILVSPDLDIDGRTDSETVVYDQMGPVFGTLWQVYWYPYARAIPHRSVLSHAPLLGTVLRIGYLLLLPTLFAVFTPLRLGAVFDAVLAFWPVWIGLAVSDVVHWMMDLRLVAVILRALRSA